jgi:hypothetical protein
MTGRFAENDRRGSCFCVFTGVCFGVRQYEGSKDKKVHHERWKQAGKMAFARRRSRIGFAGDLRPVTPFCIDTPVQNHQIVWRQRGVSTTIGIRLNINSRLFRLIDKNTGVRTALLLSRKDNEQVDA